MRWILIAVAGTVLVVVGVLRLFDGGIGATGYCVAQVGDTTVEVDPEQAKWAALMAAQGYDRGLPARATTIAIATAYQESKIHNIEYGDRDSLGLFQQRPSQGWGTAEEIMDPVHAIGRFYDGLVKVDGYETMPITEAAQAVQRSAFPTAYADHEADARALASALRGYSPAAFSCVVDPDESTPDADALEDWLDTAWGGVRVDAVEDDPTRVIALTGEDVEIRGWALAQFLVANAAEFGVTSVAFDDMRWDAERTEPGWEPTEDADRTSVRYTVG